MGRPMMSTDGIVEYTHGGEEGVVLIERLNAPYGLAFPGGHWEEGITFAQNTVKEVKEETNVDFHIYGNPEKPFLALSHPLRDPRVHMGSIVYVGRGFGEIKAGDDARKAFFASINDLEKERFAFDHGTIAQQYLVAYRSGGIER
jgi:8-oxo-dGTP diphosphatase